MTEARRRRTATQEKIKRLLDATEEIIIHEGYAAVSSRSAALKAGIAPPLVHYYFSTIDDLFIAVLQRCSAPMIEEMQSALASTEPLRAWWDIASDPRGASLLVELLAAANHRPALRAEIGKVARDLRRVQIEALTGLAAEYGLDLDDYPPALIAATVQGLAFGLVSDQVSGYETAHDVAACAVSRLITRLEARRASRLPERETAGTTSPTYGENLI
jgi:AcrR family transcriptional regulator